MGSLHSLMPGVQLQSLLGAAPPGPLALMAITCSCLQHGFTSLTHAWSAASKLAGGCAPRPVSTDGYHLLMPSAWVHFTHSCLECSFKACWGLRPQAR